MPAQKLETGIPGMIKGHLFPAGNNMAIVALVSILAFMDIVKLMAINTLGARIIFKNIGAMTGITLQRDMPILKNKFGLLIVVKRNIFPTLRAVTPVAFFFTRTIMNVIDQMT